MGRYPVDAVADAGSTLEIRFLLFLGAEEFLDRQARYLFGLAAAVDAQDIHFVVRNGEMIRIERDAGGRVANSPVGKRVLRRTRLRQQRQSYSNHHQTNAHLPDLSAVQ